jgi:hypothetical protein
MKPTPIHAVRSAGEPPAGEAALAERAARADRLEEELNRVRNERDRLEIELMVARGWVKELAVWLRVEDPPLSPRLQRLAGDDLFKLLSGMVPTSDRPGRSFRWEGVVVLVGASILLWSLLAALVFVALHLFS